MVDADYQAESLLLAGFLGMNDWDKLKEETDLAYAAFVYYRDLPAVERSLDAAYRLWVEHRDGSQRAHGARRAPGGYRKRAKDLRWAERAAAYDKHIAKIRSKAREKAIEQAAEEEAVDWFKRRRDQNEMLYELSQDMIAMAKKITSMPIVETEVDTEHGVTIVKPLRGATPTAAATLARTAEELTDKIVGEETGETGSSEGGVWTVAPDPEDEDE